MENGKENGNTFEGLTINELSDGCKQHETQFLQGDKTGFGYCLELFRRALAIKDSLAWDVIYSIYLPQVTAWVRKQLGSFQTDFIEPLTNEAFSRFSRAVTPEKFEAKFNHLSKLIQYLKMCAISSVMDHHRAAKKQQLDDGLEELEPLLPSSDPLVEKLIDDQLSAGDLWQWVWDQLKSDDERVVAELAFCYEYSSAQIFEAFPDRFESVKRVYRLQENIIRRLRRNPPNFLAE